MPPILIFASKELLDMLPPTSVPPPPVWLPHNGLCLFVRLSNCDPLHHKKNSAIYFYAVLVAVTKIIGYRGFQLSKSVRKKFGTTVRAMHSN